MEESQSVAKAVARQMLRTHRSFTATVLDPEGKVLLSVHRPFYMISSAITVKDPEGEEIGEVHQHWHMWRRRYDLFVRKEQFARCDEGFLAIQFGARSEDGQLLGFVDKHFTGFAREIFTDGRQYAIHLDPYTTLGAMAGADAAVSSEPPRVLTYDERCVMLAMGISIDFDYFSLHSGHSGAMPYMFLGGGSPSEVADRDPPPADAGGAAGGAGVGDMLPPAVGGGLGGAVGAGGGAAASESAGAAGGVGGGSGAASGAESGPSFGGGDGVGGGSTGGDGGGGFGDFGWFNFLQCGRCLSLSLSLSFSFPRFVSFTPPHPAQM